MSRLLICGVLALVACRDASSARLESNAALDGYATFRDGAAVAEQHGSVRMTVRGVGEINESCPDAAARQFIGTYDGELATESNGAFHVPLMPQSPVLVTLGGCVIDELNVERVTSVALATWIGVTPASCARACMEPACTATCEAAARSIEGRGGLTFQVLGAVDRDALEAGAFGELHAALVIDTPVDASYRSLR